MTDTIRLRDVIDTEIEQLTRYGEAATDFFHRLSDDIREEFNTKLEKILTEEVGQFQQQMRQQLTAGGMEPLGNAMGDVLGNSQNGSMYGQVFGNAVSGAVRNILMDLARSGSVDWRNVAGGANRAGGRALDAVLKEGKSGWLQPSHMNLSASQRGAQLWEGLRHAQREQ